MNNRKIGVLSIVILLALIIASVAICVTLKVGGPMIGLFASWLWVFLFCIIKKISFSDVFKGATRSISVVVPTICLLLAIGVMLGTWIQCGTISTIIIVGLKSINPQFFLPLALISCAVLSVVTGTSYGSVGSMGVAFIAIGAALNINPGMVAGAVICGSMFGDKLSPLSDTTNLAAAVANTTLSKHVKSMLWTTIPAFVITLVVFVFLGFGSAESIDVSSNVSSYIYALNGEFKTGIVTLIPVIVLIVMLLLRVNAVISLEFSAVAAGLVSLFVEKISLPQILSVAYNGYSTNIDVQVLKSILNRGGMSSMFQYVAIITFAVGLGGMLEELGVLNRILETITKNIKTDGGLILTTLIVGYITNIISCSQPMSHVLTGKLMAPMYKERKIAPEILSRSLEDSGTLSGPMIPWHGYCIYMAGTLGVAWAQFFPYLIFLYITPVISIILGYTGLSIKKTD